MREIKLSPEEQEDLRAFSDIAYEITSTMQDGTFEYDLTLPLPDFAKDKDIEVKAAENAGDLTRAESVDQPKIKENDVIKISGLDHFTIFILVPTGTANVTNGVYTVVADSFVDQNSPAANSGSATTMNVWSETGKNRRALIKFDLSSIPSGITSVSNATLQLRLSNAPGSSRQHDIYRIASDWAEGIVTWETQPSAASSPTASVVTGTTATFLTWNVAADVNAYLSGSATNYGWLIKDSEENGTTAGTFETTYITRENGTDANRPELSISFDQSDLSGFHYPSTEQVSAGNGYQTNPTGAFAPDDNYAVDSDSGAAVNSSCTSSGADKHIFSGFDLDSQIPLGATIDGLEIRQDLKVDSLTGAPFTCVQLSWDGGTTWTSVERKQTLSATAETTYTFGGGSDKWGRTWSKTNLSNANFKVRIINGDTDNGSSPRDFSLDWVGAKIYHTPDITAPTAPGAPITFSPTNNATPTWRWTASTDNITLDHYVLYWDTVAGGETNSSGSLSSGTTSFTHSSSLSNGTWYAKVKAFDTAENSSVSGNGSVVVDTTAPVGSPCIEIEGPDLCFSSIQDAINAVSSGNIITLSAGLYPVSSMITINKSVTLRGPRAGIDPRPGAGTSRSAGDPFSEAILDSGGTLATILRVAADDVVIDGLEIKSGTGDLIDSSSSSPVKQRPALKYSIIHDSSGDEGIQLRNTSSAVIEHNYVYATAGDAINLCCNSAAGTIRFNEVRDILSPDAAIYVYQSTNTTIEGNLVYNVVNNDGIKLGDKNGSDAGSSPGGTILDNVIHDTKQDGISVYQSGASVEGNEVYNSTSENGAIHVAFAVSNVTISENYVHDNPLVTSKFSDSAGILIRSTVNVASTSVSENKLEENTPFGLTNHAAAVLTATHNWWGSVTGPTHASNPGGSSDAVSDNVTFSPWCANSSCTLPTATLSGTPASSTNSQAADITVGGTNVVAYKYKLDADDYGAETDVSSHISLNALTEGNHTVSIIGKDSGGNWQVTPTAYLWTVNITAPAVTIVNPLANTTTAPNLTLRVTTNENAVCAYNLDSTGYQTMDTTGGTSHSQLLSSVAVGIHAVQFMCTDPTNNGTVSTVISWRVVSATGSTLKSGSSDVAFDSATGGQADLPSGITNVTLSDSSKLDLSGGVSTASGGDITVGGSTQTLNNYTNNDLAGVDLSLAQIIGGQEVTVEKAVKLSSGSSTVPIVVTNTAFSDASVSIPDGTTILAPIGWNGIIQPPRNGSTSGTAPSGFSVGNTVIEVGSPTAVLIFDKPVMLILNGVTGTVGYKPAGGSKWVQITDACGGSFGGPSSPAFPGECVISNGSDTKIVTYHFTTFASLKPISRSRGGGGGTTILPPFVIFSPKISSPPTAPVEGIEPAAQESPSPIATEIVTITPSLSAYLGPLSELVKKLNSFLKLGALTPVAAPQIIPEEALTANVAAPSLKWGGLSISPKVFQFIANFSKKIKVPY